MANKENTMQLFTSFRQTLLIHIVPHCLHLGNKIIKKAPLQKCGTVLQTLCMPLIEPLLNLGCRLAPLPSFLWMAIYWIDGYLQILPTIVFLLSVSSLHICSLSYMVIVLIPYTSQPYGRITHPVCNRRCAPCRQAAALPIDCGTHCALPGLRHWRRSGSWPSARVMYL